MDASLLKETEFAAIDREAWVKLAQKALKGADFDKTLISRSDDDIAIEPLYERCRKPQLTPRKNPSQPWHIVQRIDDPDPVRANRQLLEDLENGATGIALVFEGAPNAFGYGLPSTREAVDKVLYGVHLDMIHLRMDVHPKSRACADWFVDYMRPRDVNPKTLSFSLGIDPAATLAGTGRLRMTLAALKASLPQSLSGFFSSDLPGIVLEADGRVYHNAGATEAQELGAVLSIAAGHFRLFEEARQPIVYAAPHIGFALAVDQDQFLSIAKVRALRRLWAQLTGGMRRPPFACNHPCGNFLPDDDEAGSRDKYIAHDDCRPLPRPSAGRIRLRSCPIRLLMACRMRLRGASPATPSSSWPTKAIWRSWQIRPVARGRSKA